jgi:hypothetical protein
MSADAGGNIATYVQIDDPVNPTTVGTPRLAAVLAAFLTASAARPPDPLCFAVSPDRSGEYASVPLV